MRSIPHKVEKCILAVFLVLLLLRCTQNEGKANKIFLKTKPLTRVDRLCHRTYNVYLIKSDLVDISWQNMKRVRSDEG